MVRIWVISALVTLGVGAGLGLGCGGVGDLTISSNGTGTGGTSTVASGVPCDVASALTVCVSCHSDPPVGNAVGSLVTYTDLTSPAPTDSTKTMAELAITRMQDTAAPMPPGGGATAAQIKALSDWVASGSAKGDCSVDAGPPDTTFQGGPVCNSGTYYPGGEGRSMDPGMACNNCHAAQGGEAPIFTFAGTVFASGHAKDRCLPTADEKTALSQAEVVIIGADNAQITLKLKPGTSLYNGNFETTQTVKMPYTAKVVYMGKERAMLTPQTSGDCNTCHTVAGKNNAPGRIALPQ